MPSGVPHLVGGQLAVGITHDEPPQVAIVFSAPMLAAAWTPEFAVHFAQLLVKHARIAGYSGPFVELSTSTTIN